MENCIFCKIIKGEIPTKIIYQDDKVLAFADLNPQAPHHYLIIPRQHLVTLNDIETKDRELIGHMFYIAKTIAGDLGFAESGYRTLINCNPDGGQSVYHIHLHLLGGRPMQWPPG